MSTKKTHGPIAICLAVLALLAIGLPIAGCQPAVGPGGLQDATRCDRCLARSCATEVLACKDDPAPSSHKDGSLCGCLFGARILRFTSAAAAEHCGPPNDLYTAAASCWDANCADRCPKPN
jgi:hypothetical protein